MNEPRCSSDDGVARSLTLRAVWVAALLTVIALVLMHFHDGNVTHLNIVSHNFVAPAALGLMFCFVLCVNTLARRMGRGLSGGELAVVMTLMMATTPLARYYSHNLVGTIGLTNGLIYTKAGEVRPLQDANPYEVLPSQAMLDDAQSLTYLGKVTEGDQLLATPQQIPWRVWARPLMYWAPLMVCFLVFSASLAFTVYRQWAQRELVTFPIAEFMAQMVESKEDRALPDIFYNRLFWAGVGLMVAIFTFNGIHAYDERMIQVPTKFAYYELAKSFPFLSNAREGYSLLRGTFFFTMIAVAVMLPSEISFTSWVTWPLMIGASFLFYQQTGDRMPDQAFTGIQIGAFFAMAILILYAGRTFYLALFRRSVGLASPESVDGMSLWSARLLLISILGLGAVLMAYGLPPDLTVLWLFSASIFLLVSCRLVVEMGVIWLPVANLKPLAVLLMLMGKGAIGAKLYAWLSIIGSLVLPSNVSMLPLAPTVLSALKIEDRVTKRNAAAPWVIPFMLIALVVSVVSLIGLGYSFENPVDDLHVPGGVREVVNKAGASGHIYAMAGRGDVSELLRTDLTLGERWGAMSPAPGVMAWVACGFAMVLLTGIARLRMPRFPLHPLPLVLIGSWLMSRFVFAFFIGWLIKTALVKVGGGHLFRRCRPLFVGIVIGQAAIAGVWVVVNIAIAWSNQMQMRNEWFQFMRDMYSS